MMLCGFVVENYSKGALAAQLSQKERQAVREEGRLPGRLKSHDLVRLADAISFEATATELCLLKRLRRAVLWYGRYPVAVVTDMSLDRMPSPRVNPISLAWVDSHDVEDCFDLLRRLQEHVGARRCIPGHLSTRSIRTEQEVRPPQA
jgi:hypothetical protein